MAARSYIALPAKVRGMTRPVAADRSPGWAPGRRPAARSEEAPPSQQPGAITALLALQRTAGNRAVGALMASGNLSLSSPALPAMQRWGIPPIVGAAPCTLGQPGNCATYGDWINIFPDYSGSGDVNLTNDPNVPADLRKLVVDRIGSGLPDCADIAFVLRHHWLKAQGKSFSFRSGRSVKDSVTFKLGKDASDKEVRACMVGAGTGQFQDERKQFALVEYYKNKGKRITDFEELRNAGLKPGDMFVWVKRAGVKGNFQGHVQTIQSLDVKAKTMTIVQGNMQHGKGVGELQQRQYTFADLTGKLGRQG
jgi:hypothetical protein